MKKIMALVSKDAHGVSLIQGNDYHVVGIYARYFRIVDESGDPVLYPKSYFSELEATIPAGWVFHHYCEEQYTCYPKEFSARGFFEGYHDRHQKEMDIFNHYMRTVID